MPDRARKRGQPTKELRSFGTTSRELLALADWLATEDVTHIAMAATASYWKPIHNLLEDRFELLVVNAAHLGAVPGRKTDVRDAEWIADLLRHGLVRPSFIKSPGERELRELTRCRSSLVRERADELNRIDKVLEGANIKLASVASTVDGISVHAILTAIVGGAPLLVWSGNTVRQRLNRRGNRQLNVALHQIAITQLQRSGPSADYLAKRRLGRRHEDRGSGFAAVS